MRHILELLDDAHLKLVQIDEMYKNTEAYDDAVIRLMETMRAISTLDAEVDRITEEYDEAFYSRFPVKDIDNYGDKHGV